MVLSHNTTVTQSRNIYFVEIVPVLRRGKYSESTGWEPHIRPAEVGGSETTIEPLPNGWHHVPMVRPWTYKIHLRPVAFVADRHKAWKHWIRFEPQHVTSSPVSACVRLRHGIRQQIASKVYIYALDPRCIKESAEALG